MSAGFATFRRQLIWDRLIAIVEEQAQTLIRTAFSPSTREAGDLSAGVFDTMLTDIMGFLIFLGLATIFLSHLQ